MQLAESASEVLQVKFLSGFMVGGCFNNSHLVLTAAFVYK